ncbi:uncharacterized protein PHACADRAFT_210420 [Phanerochaete carnosa HHB-10118-sp]|uniref:Uncharacterized protein n=1 Tax=Phanerochaete carnosa (strain HHB-10118-sp) TaxID=650164 RepID=K5UX08_PHACS|nr:uncharacterized protein PHACADRAFT_210420 [Phanerochaete carnosa HHB-10118-sp]EKM54621.1 hypothetical protein PHACADRAFT_210420 [Phanerochaete carnosa HHB-10118-sp]
MLEPPPAHMSHSTLDTRQFQDLPLSETSAPPHWSARRAEEWASTNAVTPSATGPHRDRVSTSMYAVPNTSWPPPPAQLAEHNTSRHTMSSRVATTDSSERWNNIYQPEQGYVERRIGIASNRFTSSSCGSAALAYTSHLPTAPSPASLLTGRCMQPTSSGMRPDHHRPPSPPKTTPLSSPHKRSCDYGHALSLTPAGGSTCRALSAKAPRPPSSALSSAIPRVPTPPWGYRPSGIIHEEAWVLDEPMDAALAERLELDGARLENALSLAQAQRGSPPYRPDIHSGTVYAEAPPPRDAGRRSHRDKFSDDVHDVGAE